MTAIRKLLTIIPGWTVLVAGVIMLVTPGPGLLAMAAGLAILSKEYRWAKRLRQKVLARIARMKPGSGDKEK